MSTFKRKKIIWNIRSHPFRTPGGISGICEFPLPEVCVCVYVCPPPGSRGWGSLGGSGRWRWGLCPTNCMTRSPSLFLGPIFSFCEKAGAHPSTVTLCTA